MSINSPEVQRALLNGWLDDKNDLTHAPPAQWFASIEWTQEVIKAVFIESLWVLVEDLHPRVMQEVRHLSGEQWNIPITWRMLEWTQKKPWRPIWFNQAEVDDWDIPKICDHFHHLRDELNHMEAQLTKLIEYQTFLRAELARGNNLSRWRPDGLVLKRRHEV